MQQNAIEELRTNEGRRDVLRNVSSAHDDCGRLKNVVIPNLKQRRDALEAERTKLQNECDDSAAEIGILDMEASNIVSIQTRVDEYTRLHRDVQVLKREISQLEQDLSRSGSVKTISQVNDEYEKLQSEWYLFIYFKYHAAT